MEPDRDRLRYSPGRIVDTEFGRTLAGWCRLGFVDPFFVMRNVSLPGVFLMGFSVGLLVSVLNMGSWAEWISRTEWASFLVYFLYPLIRWDHPKNAILAFWTVTIVYLGGIWGVKEILGDPRTLDRILQDIQTEINTGIMATFLILGIYGTRLLRGWMPAR